MARPRVKYMPTSSLTVGTELSDLVRLYAKEEGLLVQDAVAQLLRIGLRHRKPECKGPTIGYLLQGAYIMACDEMDIILNEEQRNIVWDTMAWWMIKNTEQITLPERKVVDTMKEIILQELRS